MWPCEGDEVNCCTLSGTSAGDSVERTIASGPRPVNFDLFVDGPGPCVRVGFLQNGISETKVN